MVNGKQRTAFDGLRRYTGGQDDMAARARQKTKRPAPTRRTERVGVSTRSTEWYAQRIKTLEAEADRLKTQLSEAQERIGRLEESRNETVNRIDWVIDSLHNVLEQSA